MGLTNRLTGRLVRSLKPWNPEQDGPFIEVGTLVEAFPSLPGTMWQGALADTTACGQRPRMSPGIEGRTFQGWRIGVLARGLERWIVAQNPRLDLSYVQRLVGELVALEENRRRKSRAATVEGTRRAAAEKRQKKAEKPAEKKQVKAPRATSDELWKVW